MNFEAWSGRWATCAGGLAWLIAEPMNADKEPFRQHMLAEFEELAATYDEALAAYYRTGDDTTAMASERQENA